MKIRAYREIPNPLPDFDTSIYEGLIIVLDDTTILKIGERFIELRNKCIEVRGEE